MGNSFSSIWHYKTEYIVHVHTGDKKGAGTDANVYFSLYDKNGRESIPTRLNHLLSNDHERATIGSFFIANGQGFEHVSQISIWRDDAYLADDWYVDLIVVENRFKGVKRYFPINRWVKPYKKYVIQEYDCCLPQHDKNKFQRTEELEEKRSQYEYIVNVPGGPAQVKRLPDDEAFSDSYKWDLIKQKAKLMYDKMLIQWTTESWESLPDLKSVFQHSLGVPHSLERWQEDEWFGLQRVQGCNPVLIQLCTKIPDNFGVTTEMVEPFLEGMTLGTALQAKKLFMTDLKILDGIQCMEHRTICSPLALFYLNKSNTLLPIAIQLFQQKSADNPVYLPSDPKYTWLLAKMYYNNSDATEHQSITHLGFTHLVMEGVVVCTHRNLSPSHPMFRLLAPHFLFLLAINTRGLEKLVSPGGWVDKTMTCGRDGMFSIMVKKFKEWRLDISGTIPKEIESRGVLDKTVLPYYPYRDDALMLYGAIRRYVTKVVNHHYPRPGDLHEDEELLNWRKELVLEKESGGVGILGVHGDDDKGFLTNEQLIDSLTAIISICSIGHSAANFLQYEEYAFVPNYPGILHGDIPKDKNPRTEEDILSTLPDKSTTLDIMVITKLLSARNTKSLGDFEVEYLYHEVDVTAADEFREELREISKKVKEHNATRPHDYPWLDPDVVPNAISI